VSAAAADLSCDRGGAGSCRCSHQELHVSCNRSRMLEPGRAGKGERKKCSFGHGVLCNDVCPTCIGEGNTVSYFFGYSCALRVPYCATPTMIGAFWLLVKALFFCIGEGNTVLLFGCLRISISALLVQGQRTPFGCTYQPTMVSSYLIH
jgi:hypothetical protein